MRMGLLVAIALMLPHLDALAQSNVNLLTAGNFAVLAGSGITVAGAVNSTTITGDIGTYPTPSITGLGNVVLNGVNHAGDAVTQQAKNDLVTAYNDAAGRAPTTTYPPIQDLGGLILTNGVYYDSSSFAITGTLKLDAGGDPNAVWIFQAGSTLTAETGSSVILTNGAQACNVFWVVGSSATLNTGASFIGTIIALHSITIDTSATLDGRALALNDAVTLDTDAVSLPPCGVSTLAGVPADTSASCDAIPIPATVTASSTCSTQTTPAVLSESFLAGSCAYTYTLLRVWTATNACGDSFSATQSIAVADTTPPQITVPQSPIVVSGDADCQGTVPDLRGQAQVSDNCDTNPVVTQVPPGGTTFTGQTDVTLTVTDQCGNTNARTVTISTPCVPGFTLKKTLTNVYFQAGTTNQRPPQVGEAVSFVIRIVNTGTVNLVTVPVVDVYNTKVLQYVSARPPSVDNVNDGVINWTNVGPLVVGASTSIVVNFIGSGATTNPLVSTNIVMSSPTTRSEMQPRTNAVPFIINVSSIRNLPTPVELKSFTAVMTVGGVRVSWVTAVEWENLGFNVYRSSAANGVRTQINNGIIPAVGASSGSAYEWLDTSVQAGTYYYWLEDVSVDGVTQMHGPVVVAEKAITGSTSLASFEAKQPGLYRISVQTLQSAGVDMDGINPARLQVYVNGHEVSAFVTAAGATFQNQDVVLFYLPDSRDKQSIELRTGVSALRMEEVYVEPTEGEGHVWYGVAGENNMLSFVTASDYVRYLLMGFGQEWVWLLDVTDGQKPKFLYGYSLLMLQGDSAVYLSYFTAKPATCLAINANAVIDVQQVTKK